MTELQTVIITGASRGLGLASAVHLYKKGYRVVGAMRSLDAGLDALRQATGAGADDPRMLGVRLDITDPSSINAAAAEIERMAGAPDVVVQNAGIAAVGCAEEMPADVWRQVFETNLFGPVLFTNALLPSMRRAGRGRIVVVSSSGGIRGMPTICAYSASKGAVERWAEGLSQEIAPFGLGVTILVTGSFKTDIITEKTPLYAKDKSPYAGLIETINQTGRAMIAKANPPEVFARALAKAMADKAPFAKRPVGGDASALAVMSRIFPSGMVHDVIRKSLGLPKFGALRDSKSAASLNAAKPNSPEARKQYG